MTRSWRTLFGILLVLFLWSGLSVPATAETFESRIAAESGADALTDALDDDTAERLEQVQADGWFSLLSQLLQEKLTAPLQALSVLVAVMLLTRLAACFGGSSLQETTDLAGALGCAIALVHPLLSLLETTARTVSTASAFLVAAVPVYGGLLIASGFPTAGGTYSTLVLLLGNAVPVLSASLVLPALRLFLALGTAASVSSVKLSALTDSLYSFVKWALVLSVTVFSAVLSVQTTLNAQVDAAASKAVKLVTSTAVPIVGGAIGDAAAAIYNSVGLVKSGAGAFGILAVLCVFLPTLLSAVLWAATCTAAQLCADLLSCQRLSSFCKLCAATARLLLAVLCAVCAVSLVCAAVVLSIGS